MSYKFETKRTSNTSSRSRYGHGSKIVGITIHHWGSDGQRHDNVVRWLRGRAGGVNNRNSSAHYVVSAGRVTKLADDSVATWHSGNSKGNGTTIGIECRPEMSDGDWETLVQLCADLEEKHGSLKYYKHKDWKNTACPGRYSGRIGKLVDDVNAEHRRRKTGGTKPKPKPTPKPKSPAPGPGHPFPLPNRYYFGPKSGGDRSVSGFYNRSFRGKTDRYWLQEFGRQLARRGWSVGKGKTWLKRAGNDGKYGPEYAALIRRFQQDQRLAVDGLLGKNTWDAAFKNPIS